MQELQYNHRMMSFLKVQLDRVNKLKKPETASAKEWNYFNRAVEKGRRLLAKHAQPFNTSTFYTGEVVRNTVDCICEYLKAQIQEWQVDGDLELEGCVPEDSVEEDREHLHKLLAYVLKGAESGINDELLLQWLPIKQRHEEKMGNLHIIGEDMLVLKRQIGKGGFGIVYEAEWNSAAVAVKTPIREGDLPIEEFANFIKEVLVHAMLHHPYIAQMYATTPSGWLVMEAADTDLGAICHGKQRLDWRNILKLLRQAAKCLSFLHSLAPPIVHADVKTSNFLIFGKEPSTYRLKVTDFGLAFEVLDGRSKSARPGGGTLEWMAPEVYDEKPITTSSDVFSFGVTMYEVVTGAHPYGADKLDQYVKAAAVMNKKLKNQEPCTVGPNDCPKDMRGLLRRCCSLDPAKRPTMKTVSKYLRRLPANWLPSSQSLSEGSSDHLQAANRRDRAQLEQLQNQLQELAFNSTESEESPHALREHSLEDEDAANDGRDAAQGASHPARESSRKVHGRPKWGILSKLRALVGKGHGPSSDDVVVAHKSLPVWGQKLTKGKVEELNDEVEELIKEVGFDPTKYFNRSLGDFDSPADFYEDLSDRLEGDAQDVDITEYLADRLGDEHPLVVELRRREALEDVDLLDEFIKDLLGPEKAAVIYEKVPDEFHVPLEYYKELQARGKAGGFDLVPAIEAKLGKAHPLPLALRGDASAARARWPPLKKALFSKLTVSPDEVRLRYQQLGSSDTGACTTILGPFPAPFRDDTIAPSKVFSAAICSSATMKEEASVTQPPKDTDIEAPPTAMTSQGINATLDAKEVAPHFMGDLPCGAEGPLNAAEAGPDAAQGTPYVARKSQRAAKGSSMLGCLFKCLPTGRCGQKPQSRVVLRNGN